MQFICPNVLAINERNFSHSLNKMLFFDENTNTTDLDIDSWNSKVLAVRSVAYKYEDNKFFTGHAQGQRTATQYYPANFGRILDDSPLEYAKGSEYDGFRRPRNPVRSAPSKISEYISIDSVPDSIDHPVVGNYTDIHGLQSKGYAAPDYKVLYVVGKSFPLANSLISGTVNTAKELYSTYNDRPWQSDRDDWYGTTAAFIINPNTGAQAAQSFSIRTTLSDIAIASTGNCFLTLERTMYYFRYVNYTPNNIATHYTGFQKFQYLPSRPEINNSTICTIMFPVDGTPETPVINSGAMLTMLNMEKVFIRLSQTDFSPMQITPGSMHIIDATSINMPEIYKSKQIYKV